MATIVGTTIKLSIEVIDGISPLTMDDIEFTCDFFCTHSRKYTVAKSDMKKSTSNNYIAAVDTTDLGAGYLKMRMNARVPDTQCPKGYRVEIVEVDTNIELEK